MYVYRDASNWIRCGQLSFEGRATPELVARLTAAFEDGVYFIADQIRMPECFLWSPQADYDPDDGSSIPESPVAGEYAISDDDHCWHELQGVSNVEPELAAVSLDPHGRSFEQFVVEVENAARCGWREFDPAERVGK
jgi:hypothetical protein